MLPLLYRDDHLVAIHKPAGLLVHRSELDRHETRFAVQMLRDQLGCHVHPLHRLDRGTSGVLLFALDRDTARLGSALFEHQAVDKTYLAVVRGHPPQSGRIDHPLSRRRDEAEWRGDASSDTAQPAVTDFVRLATCELPFAVDRYPSSRYALLEVRPLTGRRHQIRRHLKHIAPPLIGDATFGKGRHNRFFADHFGCARMLLACTRLRLIHPRSGAPLDLVAPPEGDFLRLLDSLGWRPALPAILRTPPAA
ncbi:MAG TPA: pseudouridine synthase [Rhodocyclaceae bacterium]|nr:pseudouridine synthase [Rhodocyclaceae bacterium]